MASTGVQTFTAADTTALADLGWTEDAGHYHVVSNKAVPQTSGTNHRARYTDTELDSANHWVKATIGPSGGGPYAGLTARQASSTYTCYLGQYEHDENDWDDAFRIVKIIAGGETILDESGNPGWGASGDHILTFTVDGASQILYDDTKTQEICSAADGVITAGNFVGIRAWANVSTFDDFSAADLAAGEGAIPLLFGGCLDTSMGGNTNVMTG